MTDAPYQIITFYRFRRLDDLERLRLDLIDAMRSNDIFGTIILAEEGFNSTVCGRRESIPAFLRDITRILGDFEYKSSFHGKFPFRRVHVKIKPEIVTLKKDVDISLGNGTHVPAEKWNEIIAREDVFVLDTRNDYEFRVGTFAGAVNPETTKFSELPDFVAENLDPARHKKIAMFCTGGIRCEKFAPYMRQLGFEEIYQLEGGILKYLEVTPADQSLWTGECYVFDDRVTVDDNLTKGSASDLSLEVKGEKDEAAD